MRRWVQVSILLVLIVLCVNIGYLNFQNQQKERKINHVGSSAYYNTLSLAECYNKEFSRCSEAIVQLFGLIEENSKLITEMNQDVENVFGAVQESVKQSIQYTDTVVSKERDTLPDLYKETYFSVVTIEKLTPDLNRYGFEIGPPSWSTRGTGVFLGHTGLVLTAGHVLDLDSRENIIKLRVKMPNNGVFEIMDSAFFTDLVPDLGIAKIDLPDGYKMLEPIQFGDMGSLKIGQEVCVVGHPYGLDYTITKGVLSRIGREEIDGVSQLFLQTDAPINGGNSGGPIFGLDGKCYGICSWHFERADGLAFFVPVSAIKKSIPILLKKMCED